MKKYRGGVLLVILFTASSCPAWAAERSFHQLTTGNGHGFSIFDRETGRVDAFLEHPYAYVAALDDEGKSGIARRQLAHDIYFGIQTPSHALWLTQPEHVAYLQESNVIQARQMVGNVETRAHYFSPFGLAANALVMVLEVTNHGATKQNIAVAAKPNLKLGTGRPHPNDVDEQISVVQGSPPYAVETGPGGGHALYIPLNSQIKISCGEDSIQYDALLERDLSPTKTECAGSSLVPLLTQELSLAPGERAHWGVAIVFVNDTPSHSRAASFRDSTTLSGRLRQWDEFQGYNTAQSLLHGALSEFENWRTQAPAQLSAEELKLWRQSESILRMGQIRENENNTGMILAALPPGEWHVGWVRDAAYAIASLSQIGHYDEARKGLNFFFNARAGFYNRPEFYELARPYRVSVCRYFGNGTEESDWNAAGPNFETDGWGLVLWAAHSYINSSCDTEWLDEITAHGDTVYEALLHIGQDIEGLIMEDLPAPDNSIWEVHWDHRQVFAYTVAAQIRGLFDLAAIASLRGDVDIAKHYSKLAQRMKDKARAALVHGPTQSIASHQEAAVTATHVDGSTVEFLNWGIFEPGSNVYKGTLSHYAEIETPFGGYRRLDPELSLVQDTQATVYDTREWVMMDLRIGNAWWHSQLPDGKTRAQTLLATVTELAGQNDNLISELYHPQTGAYEGAIPMVGYGAGAWMTSKLLHEGVSEVALGQELGHCFKNSHVEPPEVIHEGGCQASGSPVLWFLMFMLGIRKRLVILNR